MVKPIDITGRVFGRLTAIKLAPNRENTRRRMWLCRCECGKERLFFQSDITSGNTRSCGCLRLDNPSRLTHGMTNTPDYCIWSDMIKRCYNPRHKKYDRYGGRGIQVCDEWKNSFKQFIADVGRRPEPSLTLERIDNDGDYRPDNVRWATRREQARNRSSNNIITFDGKSMSIAAWSDVTGISQGAIWNRIYNCGWSICDALTKPIDTRKTGRSNHGKAS